MQTPSQLIPATSKTPEEEWRELVDRIAKLLDPDYPSVIIGPPLPGIGEPSNAYLEKDKPDFVKADDRGWG